MKKKKFLPNNGTRNTNSDESDRDCDSDVVYRDIETAAVLGLCSLATPTITIEDEIDRISETDEDDSSYATADEDDSFSSDDEYDDVDTGACEVVEDILEENKVTSTLEDYDDRQLVFSEADMELWKTKEKALAERYKSGYYRCKVKHAEVYEQILTLYKPYITEEALKILAHPFTTQTNEAMNKSVSTFAPKGKTLSKTESLDARVAIAAGCQILGYEYFWDQVFEEFGMVMDSNLRSYLRNLERKKQSKKNVRSD